MMSVGKSAASSTDSAVQDSWGLGGGTVDRTVSLRALDSRLGYPGPFLVTLSKGLTSLILDLFVNWS